MPAARREEPPRTLAGDCDGEVDGVLLMRTVCLIQSTWERSCPADKGLEYAVDAQAGEDTLLCHELTLVSRVVSV